MRVDATSGYDGMAAAYRLIPFAWDRGQLTGDSGFSPRGPIIDTLVPLTSADPVYYCKA